MNKTDSNASDARLTSDLETLRMQSPTAPAYLQQRIVANLPEREPALELLAWLRASAWRFTTAAALPLVLGFVTGAMLGSEEISYPDTIVYADIWEAYESNEI